MAEYSAVIAEAPPFWWRGPGWQAWALWPISAIYGRIAARRLRARRNPDFELPVLQVLSPTAGGAGCTEVTAAIALAARQMGAKPGIIAGARAGVPAHLVDPHEDLPKHVGDEAPQLARAAPTVLCSDRLAGARMLAAEGFDLVLVCDGDAAGNPVPDYTLLVADAARGLGNGHVAPAGPLRAPLVDQISHSSAVLRVGRGDRAERIVRMAARAGRPFFEASIGLRSGPDLSGRKWLAFAGVADPDGFFRLVEAAGGEIAVRRVFAERHLYAEDEAADLMDAARRDGLSLVTTVRDALRLHHGGAQAKALGHAAVALETELAFDVADVPQAIVSDVLEAFRLRQFKRR